MKLFYHPCHVFGILSAAFLFTQCSEQLTPVSPKWDIEVNMPIATRMYTIEDLIQLDASLSDAQRQETLRTLNVTFAAKNISNSIELDYSATHQETAKRMVSGDLFTSIGSQLPAEVKIKLDFLDQNKQILYSPKDASGYTASIPAASIASSTQRTEVHLSASGDELRKLFSAAYLRYTFELNTPNGEAVQFTAGSFIHLHSKVNAIAHNPVIIN